MGMPFGSVAMKVTAAAHRPASVLTVVSFGHMIMGGTSSTVTVKVQSSVLPAPSVTV